MDLSNIWTYTLEDQEDILAFIEEKRLPQEVAEHLIMKQVKKEDLMLMTPTMLEGLGFSPAGFAHHIYNKINMNYANSGRLRFDDILKRRADFPHYSSGSKRPRTSTENIGVQTGQELDFYNPDHNAVSTSTSNTSTDQMKELFSHHFQCLENSVEEIKQDLTTLRQEIHNNFSSNQQYSNGKYYGASSPLPMVIYQNSPPMPSYPLSSRSEVPVRVELSQSPPSVSHQSLFLSEPDVTRIFHPTSDIAAIPDDIAAAALRTHSLSKAVRSLVTSLFTLKEQLTMNLSGRTNIEEKGIMQPICPRRLHLVHELMRKSFPDYSPGKVNREIGEKLREIQRKHVRIS